MIWQGATVGSFGAYTQCRLLLCASHSLNAALLWRYAPFMRAGPRDSNECSFIQKPLSLPNVQAEREARMERDARRAAGLPGVEPGAGDEDDDSDSEEILDLVPEVTLH